MSSHHAWFLFLSIGECEKVFDDFDGVLTPKVEFTVADFFSIQLVIFVDTVQSLTELCWYLREVRVILRIALV